MWASTPTYVTLCVDRMPLNKVYVHLLTAEDTAGSEADFARKVMTI